MNPWAWDEVVTSPAQTDGLVGSQREQVTAKVMLQQVPPVR